MSLTPLLKVEEETSRPVFFIAGTPRARTAWLANFFDYAPVSCRHELLSEGATLDAFEQHLQEAEGDVAGTADTMLPFFADAVRERFPGARWAIVNRPRLEIERSLRALAVPEDAARQVATQTTDAAADMARDFPDAMQMEYRQLADAGAMRELWEHCTQSRTFPIERFHALRDIQVQIHPRRFALWLGARLANVNTLRAQLLPMIA